jgi:hypothetical protein
MSPRRRKRRQRVRWMKGVQGAMAERSSGCSGREEWKKNSV